MSAGSGVTSGRSSPSAASASMRRPAISRSASRLSSSWLAASISWAAADSWRARVVHVGDGGESDLQSSLGEFQLARVGRLFGACELERVLRDQRVEVGLGGAQHQVLLRGAVLGLHAAHVGVRLAQAGERGAVEHRLCEAEGVGGAVVVGRTGRAAADGAVGDGFVLVAVLARRGVDRRQQQRTRLWQFLQPALVAGLGAAEARVARARRRVDRQQILGRCSRRGSRRLFPTPLYLLRP